MTTPMQQKRSTVAGTVPTTSDIQSGALAINLVDRILYTSNGTATYQLAGPVIIQNTAPTSIVAGSLWWNNNDGSLKIYYNDGTSSQWVDAFVGTTAPVVSTVKNQSFRLASPQNNDSPTLLYTNTSITITELKSVVSGTTPSVTLALYYGPDRSGVGNTVIQSGVVTSNVTTGNTLVSFTNSVIPGNSYIWCTANSISGTVNELFVNLRFL